MSANDLPRKSLGQGLLDLAMAATVLNAEGFNIMSATVFGFDAPAHVQIGYDKRLEELVNAGQAIRRQTTEGAHIEWMRDGVKIAAVAPPAKSWEACETLEVKGGAA